MLKAIALAAFVALLGGCASALTPQQSRVEEHFAACRPEGPSTRLVWVSPEGRFFMEGQMTDPERVKQCMQTRYGYRF